MKNLTLENLTKVCGGVYFGPSDKLEQEVSSITTDSRKAEVTKKAMYAEYKMKRMAV